MGIVRVPRSPVSRVEDGGGHRAPTAPVLGYSHNGAPEGTPGDTSGHAVVTDSEVTR